MRKKAAGEKRVKKKEKDCRRAGNGKEKSETGTAAGQEEESEPEQEEKAGESDEAKEESPAEVANQGGSKYEEAMEKACFQAQGPEEGEKPDQPTLRNRY